MATLTLTRGLPGSGKTTWATQQIANSQTLLGRSNRDDLRMTMFGAYVLRYEQEERVTVAQHGAVAAMLANGMDVINDDTNLRAKTVKAWYKVADSVGAEVVFKDFNTPLDVCLQRVAAREAAGGRGVPEHIVREMYAKYFRKGSLPAIPERDARTNLDIVPYVDDPSLPEVMLCDLDGTMAKNNSGRGFYDWKRVGEDDLIEATHRTVNALAATGVEVIFFSGRDAECRPETTAWLESHGFGSPRLYMRPAGSMEPDDKVKLKMFNDVIRDRYRVVAVFDDRISVCRLWHALGLPLFRVGDPDAVF